jgi:hypothetical protein
MQRSRLVRIVLGVVLALAAFSFSGIATGGSSWEPIEVRSCLFQNAASAHNGRDAHLDTRATFARWARRGVTRAALAIPAPGAGPRGALISLVAFAQGGPPPFISVLTGPGNDVNNCSTGLAPAATCSTFAATNSTCSANQYGVPAFCSAAIGTALTCSSISSTGGSCSAYGFNALCSTSTGNGAGQFTCSVQGGTGTCSTLVDPGPPPVQSTGSSCTALSGQGASGSTCSVTSGTGGASCTATNTAGSSGFCSVQSTGQPADFCSVYGPPANPPNTCSLIGTGGSATCSVWPGSSGNCTVMVGPGVFLTCNAQPPP